MFEILPNPSLDTILVAARAALLVGAFWIFALAFIRWRRADERQTQQLQMQLQQTFAEVRSLHETIAVMNARIESLGERADSDTRFVPQAVPSSQRGYDLAARLAKNGSGVDELVTSCGITRHEAELLTRLHAAKSRAAQPQPAASVQPSAPAAAPAPQATGPRKRGSLLSVVG